MNTIIVIFYILLIDALAANILAYFGRRWYTKHLRVFSRLFPPAKGWSLYYLVLVLFIGYILAWTGHLVF